MCSYCYRFHVIPAKNGFQRKYSLSTLVGVLNGVSSYTYDSKDQITQESSTRNGGFTDNFGYDSAGNPTTFKGVTKSYNSNNQQTATGFVHDGNGNPTTYGGTTLTFDPEDRMTAYGSVLTAGYTGDGLRGWKQNASGGFSQITPGAGAPPPLVEGKVYKAGGPAFSANGESIHFTIKDDRAVQLPKTN